MKIKLSCSVGSECKKRLNGAAFNLVDLAHKRLHIIQEFFGFGFGILNNALALRLGGRNGQLTLILEISKHGPKFFPVSVQLKTDFIPGVFSVVRGVQYAYGCSSGNTCQKSEK